MGIQNLSDFPAIAMTEPIQSVTCDEEGVEQGVPGQLHGQQEVVGDGAVLAGQPAPQKLPLAEDGEGAPGFGDLARSPLLG